MNEWAPIVRVPARFIVLPDFLVNEQDQQWSKRYIAATMRSPEELIHKGPRWVLFQNETYRIFGVTCMASELGGEHYQRTRAKYGRAVYAFVGYAAHRAENDLFPALPNSLTQFIGLYEYIQAHWDDDPDKPPDCIAPDKQNLTVILRPARRYSRLNMHSIKKDKRRRWNLALAKRRLNEDLNQVALWPDSPLRRHLLWQAVSLCNGSISLCLGLASRGDAQLSPFLNATVIGLIRKEQLQRSET